MPRCSTGMLRPGRACTCLLKTSSDKASSPAPISSKNDSRRVPLCWTSRRSAAPTSAALAVAMRVHTARAFSKKDSLLFSCCSTCRVTLARSCVASCKGPRPAFARAGWCWLKHVLTSATAAEATTASFAASSRTARGLMKSKESESPSSRTASSNFRLFSSMSFTFSATTARTALAAFRSRASRCNLRSASCFFVNSLFASATLRLSSSIFFAPVTAFGLSFDISCLASCRAP
mmetsp:Transcript_31778/g.84841  ORF Transcript_31778/g.84841 Transcript_31778/m.84841 type:complete len:234 (-) Transcript_31778:2053-2754(-)